VQNVPKVQLAESCRSSKTFGTVRKISHWQAERLVVKGSFKSKPAWCAAVRGTTIETTRAVRTAIGTNPITSTTTSVFVWFAPHRYALCRKCGVVMNCSAEALNDG